MLVPFLLSLLANAALGTLAGVSSANSVRASFVAVLAVLLLPAFAFVGMNVLLQNTVIMLGFERSQLTWFGLIPYILLWIWTGRHITASRSKPDPVSEGAG